MAFMNKYKFNTIKNREGKVRAKLSFIFSLTPNPNIINKANPPDEISKIKLDTKPINRPNPPMSSSKAVSF